MAISTADQADPRCAVVRPRQGGEMAFLITHFYEGGTKDQYEAVLKSRTPAGWRAPARSAVPRCGTDGGRLADRRGVGLEGFVRLVLERRPDASVTEDVRWFRRSATGAERRSREPGHGIGRDGSSVTAPRALACGRSSDRPDRGSGSSTSSHRRPREPCRAPRGGRRASIPRQSV